MTNTAERVTRTTTDTIEITPKLAASWKSPPFQRPLRINDKVRNVALKIRTDGGVIPGILTLGVLAGVTYLLDGQHRRESFLMSELPVGYVDVRTRHFDTMAEMADEYIELNSKLVPLKPDDILRGLETGNDHLVTLRKRCPFIGYDNIRRSDKSPVLSMSSALRVWFGSEKESPVTTNISPIGVSSQLTEMEVQQMSGFMSIAHAAWGNDPVNQRLWGALNLILCAWLYRRTVLTQYGRSIRLDKETFKKCLMSLSADPDFVAWLMGRNLSERNRAPAFNRMKSIFSRRIEIEIGKKGALPAPEWSHS